MDRLVLVEIIGFAFVGLLLFDISRKLGSDGSTRPDVSISKSIGRIEEILTAELSYRPHDILGFRHEIAEAFEKLERAIEKLDQS